MPSPRPARPSFPVLVAVALAASVPAEGLAQPAAEEQIAGALLAAPSTLRAEATVLGYGGTERADDPLSVLRPGTNGLICLADDPETEGFHVACYHESMDPFMAMGRRLRAEGRSREEVQEARLAAVESGEIAAPSAALWSVSAPSDVDPASGPGSEARRLSVVYLPYARAEEIGLPTRPDGESPWLMLAGTPWAHVMIPR